MQYLQYWEHSKAISFMSVLVRVDSVCMSIEDFNYGIIVDDVFYVPEIEAVHVSESNIPGEFEFIVLFLFDNAMWMSVES